MAWWSEREYKTLTSSEVKDLPVGTQVHLQGPDRYGATVQLEGRIAFRKDGKKCFLFYDSMRFQTYKEIKTYKGKIWTIRKEPED
jgi:hypothetical protein